MAKATTSVTKRAALYVRVSSDEQVEGYSLPAQERAIEAYCVLHGYDIAVHYRDEGKSARTDDLAKRPAFRQMLEDAGAGLFDIVVVHKLDRFARNLRVTLETLDRLEKANVGFVSVNENMDFATPMGRVVLSTMGSLAQFYSDNLSAETKKGNAERKAQGLYNGVLPFGLTKNAGDRIPVPDPTTYPGLLLAFELAADGKSDRAVAEALNAAGYRTTGNRGPNPFTKDTVCRMLKNRFYLGELPDGRGGWVPGAHQPVLAQDLFERARRARDANATNAAKVNRRHRRYSLSGLAVCGHCGGPLHFHTERSGRARVYCYQGRQAKQCGQRSSFLEGIDDQIAAYLGTFRLPDDTVARIVAFHERASDEHHDTGIRRREMEGRLERIAELYKWGDLTREAYVAERDRLQAELSALRTTADGAGLITRAAALLRDLPAAWAAATPDQRNTLARLIFQQVEIEDDRVAAVVPQPDFAPFFALAEDNETGWLDEATPECQVTSLAGGSDGDRLALAS